MEGLYFLMFVCYSSYVYNRKVGSLVMPNMIEEGLDTSDAGLIASSLMIAFAVSKFMAGVLSDHLNPHILFLTGLFLSGLSTLIYSMSSSIEVFCAMGFLNGLAQGCGWPAIAKILRQRASPSQFGTLWSLLSSSVNVSGSFGPFLSAVMAVHFGWRWSVGFAGSISLFLLIVYLLCLPFLSKPEERVKKREDGAKSSSDDRARTLDLFFDPLVLFLSACFMVLLCARTATVNWGQLYLMKDHGHPLYVATAFISSVETAGFLGRVAAGYITDWSIRRRALSGKKVGGNNRMSVAIIFMAASIVSLHLLCFNVSKDSSTAWIVLIGALLGMSYYGPIALVGILSSESVPSHLSGTSHAIVSMFGNVGATVSGLPFSYIAKHYDWGRVFLCVEIIMTATFFLMLFCRNLRSTLKKEDKSD